MVDRHRMMQHGSGKAPPRIGWVRRAPNPVIIFDDAFDLQYKQILGLYGSVNDYVWQGLGAGMDYGRQGIVILTP